MKNIFQNFIQRNFKKIPYFFERKQQFYIEQYNYALLGKLSSSILHDILTPLTSILLATQLDKKDQTKTIETSTKELKEYVEVLRDFAYQDISDKKIHVNKEISKSILLLRHKSIADNIQIQYIEYDQIFLNIHPLHLYQIIINLVSNAIDASVESKIKKVIISLKKHPSHIQIECRDFANGIPKEILKHAGKEILSTKSNSRGFGLYSVYYIVEKILKGTITIHTGKNIGTYITCRIPTT
jgi:signal transduction histidine kinase